MLCEEFIVTFHPKRRVIAMKNGFSWKNITHVLLDLDGTLLDRDFDDTFYELTVPREYARKNGISFEAAREKVLAIYRREEGTLNWFDIEYWSRELEMDLCTLKIRESKKIRPLPGTWEFLDFVRNLGKSMHLFTDAHPQALAIKLERVPLKGYFDSIVSAFDVGCTKKESRFWEEAQRLIEFDSATSLFVDDRPQVLERASRFGVAYVFHKVGATSTRLVECHDGFFPLVDFSEILEG